MSSSGAHSTMVTSYDTQNAVSKCGHHSNSIAEMSAPIIQSEQTA